MELRKFLTILTIFLLIILGIVIWFFPSNEDFQMENPFWNGTKDMKTIVPAMPLASLSNLPSLPLDSTLILIPYLEFSQEELATLPTFVTQGGTLILADDYGFGNQLLAALGLKARFSGGVLIDPLFSYKNKWFPRISHLTPSSATSNTTSLVFNHATALTDVDDGEVLARSSFFSFLDLNDNQAWDRNEPVGPLPVITRYNVGRGQLVLIADPSIFINSMKKIESNYALIQNMAAITTSRLFIDQSHLPPSNLQQTKNRLATTRSLLMTPAGTLGLMIVALSLTLMPIWWKKEKEPKRS